MVSRRSGSIKADQRKHRNANSRFDGTTGAVPGRDLPPGFGECNHFLTVAQAAEICQISKRQMYRMIRDGRIPVLGFGRSVRIRPADLGI
jgi:excisionase family DNA binding protein